MNLFGWQKEEMSQESKDPSTKSSGLNGGAKEVTLFPAVMGRKGGFPMVAPRNSNPPGTTQISLFTPVTFDEALDIVQCLRERAATTICIEKMREDDASRLVDFVAGASAAIDGDFFKMSEDVYLFCPSNIRITAPGKEYDQMKKGASPLDSIYPGGVDNSGIIESFWPTGQH